MILAEVIIWFAIFFYASAGFLAIFQFYYLSSKISPILLVVIAFVLHLILLVDLFLLGNLPFNELYTWLYLISYLVACVRLSVRFQDGIGWSHAIFPFISATLLVGLLISRYPGVIVDSFSSRFILLSHIILMILGYTLLSLSCVSCLLFWKQEKQIKVHAFKLFSNRFPSLGKLDRSAQVFLKWGLCLQTGGLLMGVILADFLDTPSSFWRLAIATMTWGVFVLLALYHAFQNKQRLLHGILSIAGLSMMIGSLYFEFAYFSNY